MTKNKKPSEAVNSAPGEELATGITVDPAMSVPTEPATPGPVKADTKRRLGTGAIVGISAAGVMLLLGSAGAGFAAGVAVSHSPGSISQGQFDRGGFGDQNGDGEQAGPPPGDFGGQPPQRSGGQNSNQQKNGTDPDTDSDSNSNSGSDTQNDSS